MIYKTLRPNPQLEPYVDCIWLLAASQTTTALSDEIVLPDGKTEFIIHFGDHFELRGDNNKFEKQSRCLFAGQLTEHIVLRGTGDAGMVAVRFKPGGSCRFFRIPHHELSEQVVNARDIFDRAVDEIQERIINASNHDERMRLMEQFLLTRMKHQEFDDAVIRQACRYIVQSGGAYTINELVNLVGLSERQLERRSKENVGVSPKTLARIVRFQRFIEIAQANRVSTLTDAAMACGYYDQAHFIRDFRAFSGVSPTTYLSQPHIMSDFFTAST